MPRNLRTPRPASLLIGRAHACTPVSHGRGSAPRAASGEVRPFLVGKFMPCRGSVHRIDPDGWGAAADT
jgi:hypothetical protein